MIFGHYEYVAIDIDQLIILPQVRKIRNAKIDEIADSIKDCGLINPLDVARLDYDGFKSHVKFLNQLWKKEIDVDSFASFNNYYYVVIAGHSRLEALNSIAKEDNRSVQVAIKIHEVKTSEEILSIQLNENIYMGTRLEERAVAIIETYRLGIINNKWCDKNEFIKQNQNKFSRNVLNDALVFADLPLEVQEYVFSNNIPFAIGVELGRMYPLIEKHVASGVDNDQLLDENIRLHYAILLIRLQKASSIKRGLSIISAHCKGLRDHFEPEEKFQQEMISWWVKGDGAEHQGESFRKELEKEYNNAVKGLVSMPYEYFVKLFNLDNTLTGKNHLDDIQAIKKLYHQYNKPVCKKSN